MDLSKTSGQTELWKLPSFPNLCFVHLSPPCGMASRARERPLPAALRAKGWPEPQPLRSEEYPMSLPNLAIVSLGNVARVATANKLFLLSAEICTYLCRRRIPWTLENPRRSLFWWVPEVQALMNLLDVELGPRACSAGRKYVDDIFSQHCMHGGARDKWTRLRCYPATIFASLALSCNNDHEHKPWGAAGPGRFYTADEARVPPIALFPYRVHCPVPYPAVYTTIPSRANNLSSSSSSQPTCPLRLRLPYILPATSRRSPRTNPPRKRLRRHPASRPLV